MKFWELIAAFRNETDNLKSVLQQQRWRKYQICYCNLEAIQAMQDKRILDEDIPFQLAKEVCELSELTFFLYYREEPHRLSKNKLDTDQPFEQLSPYDILVRFGGAFIARTIENGVSEVMPGVIGNDIEVLAVYKLTNIGMMAFLRMDNGFLKKGDQIGSLDNLRQWTVLEEPFILVDPYEAKEKRERQKEQGIRLYKILPMNGSGKPQETEILKLYRTIQLANPGSVF
ncbi:hypothetical protein [Taibaiella koreensis]|uniref:hypothetical protein n=1 Tax=Taibaiella koreensis TaxID=1268548 RepID=UPI000E59F02D|nr:hypothetical protein [Taibaiella koreensis]